MSNLPYPGMDFTPFDTLPAADLDKLVANIEALAAGSGVVSGSVVQIKNFQTGAFASGSTIQPIDNTIPQNTEGDQYMSLAITPKSSSNILIITVIAQMFEGTSVGNITGALFQDSTANALAASIFSTSSAIGGGSPVTFTHKMTAGTTSATTFKFRAGLQVAGGVLSFNGIGGLPYLGGVLASSITITEVKA